MYKIATRYFLYSLSFLALNKLIKKERTQFDERVPSFRGIAEVVHNLEGRTRFKIPSLKGDEEGFKILKEQLLKIESITSVETSPITGTLLLSYSKDIEPTLLLGIIIKLLGLEEKIKAGNESLITREVRNIEESMTLAIEEKTNGLLDLRSVLFLSLMALGIRNLIKYPNLTPPAFNYLWGAYTIINL